MSNNIPKNQQRSIDRLYWTPSERAVGILSILETVRDGMREENEKKGRDPDYDVPSDWDFLCFAVEYIGQQALILDDPDFLKAAIWINRWLYSAHYNEPSKIYGSPDRKEPQKDRNATPTDRSEP